MPSDQNKQFPVSGFANFTLRTKLLIAFLLVSLVAVGGMALLINRVTGTILSEQVGANLNRLANSQAISTGNLLAQQVELLQLLSTNQLLVERVSQANRNYSGLTTEAIEAELLDQDEKWTNTTDTSLDVVLRTKNIASDELRAFRDRFPNYTEVFITDKYGGLAAATNRTTDYYQADEDWWQAAFNGGQGAVYISTAMDDESSHSFGMNIAVPLYEQGEVLGILKTTYGLATLSEVLEAADSAEQGVRSQLLFLQDKQLLADNGQGVVPFPADVAAQIQQSTTTDFDMLTFANIPSLISQARLTTIDQNPVITNLDWYIIAHQNQQQAFALVSQQQRSIVILAVVMVAIAGFVAVGIAHLLARPIVQLTNVVQQVTQGNLDVQAPVSTQDEIGVLGTSFNLMTNRLHNLIGSLEGEIAERRQAEEELRRNEENLRTTLNSIGDAVIATDTAGNITRMNPVAEHLTGWTFAEVLGKPLTVVFNIINAQTGEAAINPVDMVLENRKTVGLANHTVLIARTGAEYQIADSAAPIRSADGRITGVVLVFRDVTEEYRMQKALRESEERFRDLAEMLPVGVFEANPDLTITYANNTAFEMFGYSQEDFASGLNGLEMIAPEERERARENFTKRQTGEDVGTVEYKALRKDGSLLHTLFHPNAIIKEGNLSGFRGVIIDITERKQIEEETLRQERLAAVGQLAAGIAHDFNNLLTSMIGFAELVQHRYDLPDKAKSDLARIAKQGLRAAKLTRQILDFSRQTINEPQPLDLNVYLNETLKFIERTIPENIEIRFNFGRGDHTINADPTQLQQVITNLAVNARDAMPGGGMLTFTLSRTTVTPDEPPPCSEMEAGEWVKLAVTDTGEGIASEIFGHIFEPFFTTKEIGQGTGLGLAQIYGIVQQHGGCISVDSQVSQGSTFTLYFPALTSQVSAANKAVETLAKGQGQTILLVEDEQVVREVAQAMLEMLNYRVLAAKNGEEGLTLYRAQADQIALVLTDAMMPKMDGFALASALQKEAPHLNVVLMTGYARDTEVQAETIQNIVNRLQKPLNLHQLADAMQQALT